MAKFRPTKDFMKDSSNNRKIIHVDMDCFYAAIEARDNSYLKDKPLAVGGQPNKRGVICACNYIARKFGVHSAMPTAKALKLCPNLTVLPPNMKYYSNISKKIRMIFNEFSPFVEPLSLDEAFLDVTESKQCGGSATLMAEAIRQKIFVRHHLRASAGVAPNKFLAKIASDWNKPNGIFVIRPEEVAGFIATLPVEKIFGVGKVTAAKLHKMDIKTCKELQNLSIHEMSNIFGSFGTTLYDLARGKDNRTIAPRRKAKSVSVEETFLADINNRNACIKPLGILFERLQARLEKHQKRLIHKLFVKIKFADFTSTTKECIANELLLNVFKSLFYDAAARQNKAIRLLGLGARFGENAEPRQIRLEGFE